MQNRSIARIDPRARDEIKHEIAPRTLRDALGTPKKASLLTGRAQRTMRGWFDGTDSLLSRWLEFVATVARSTGANPYALLVASEIVIATQRLATMAHSELGAVWRGERTEAARDAGNLLGMLAGIASREADDMTDVEIEQLEDTAVKCARTLAQLVGTCRLIRQKRGQSQGRKE